MPRTEPLRAALPERFEIRRSLGHGAFGEVWLAYDQVRKADVAVKRLIANRASDIRRFKQEFRALSAMHHPNLVTLYELLCIDAQWLLTMEYVAGTRIESTEQWRVALPGIVAGLDALHHAGHLHRDVKAGNLLIAGERAVLLDFGLVGHVGGPTELVGSLSGIAPEQLAQGQLDPASDFYALGAMLYSSLVGEPPFDGRGAQVIAKKLRVAAPKVADVNASVAAASPLLAELADALLERDPVLRMEKAADPLERMGAKRKAPATPATVVGRAPERDALTKELQLAQAGEVRHVRLTGPMAIGKSTLLRAWSSALPAGDSTLFLGRCFELDGTDHSGMDDVVGQLLAREGGDALDSDQLRALARVYPGSARAPKGGAELGPGDSAELIRRATNAVSQLLAAPSLGCPVLVIDDAHWGDAATGRLLARLEVPALLIISVERSEEPDRGLLEALDAARPPGRRIQLEGLTAPELRVLAAEMNVRDVESFVGQSKGQPLLARELAASHRRHGGGSVDLDELLAERIVGLPPSARIALDILTAAARPIDRALADAAVDVASVAPHAGLAFGALTTLQRERLVRSTHTRAGTQVEVMHDVVARANATKIEHATATRAHRALDDAMDALGVDDPEAQARHSEEAGRTGKAQRLFVQAAEYAVTALRFGHGARLYKRSIALVPTSDRELWRTLHHKRAVALGHAGRHNDSASAFAAALDGRILSLENPDTMALGRGRAEHLMHAGNMPAGYVALAQCLGTAKLPLPTDSAWAIPSIIADTQKLHWSDYRVDVQTASPSKQELARIDLCFSAGLALTIVDARGAGYALRSAILAKEAGDSYRFARGIAVAANYAGATGPKSRVRLQKMLAVVDEQAAVRDDGYLSGLSLGARLVADFHVGKHEESLDLAYRAEREFRRTGASMRERVSSQIYQCSNLSALGRWDELDVERQRLYEDAHARGDRFGATASCVGLGYMVWLARDESARTRRELNSAMSEWSEDAFHFTHFFALMAHCRVDLYDGRPERALQRLRGARLPLFKSMLWRMPYVRVQLRDLEARAHLATIKSRGSLERWFTTRRVRWLSARIRSEAAECFSVHSDVIDGALAWESGDTPTACAALENAVHGFVSYGQQPHAAAAAHTLQQLGGRVITVAALPVKCEARFSAALGWNATTTQ